MDNNSDPKPPVTAAEHLDNFVALGPEKLRGIAGAALVLSGFFLPVFQAEGGFASASVNLTQAGLIGILIVASGIVIGAVPFYLANTIRNNVLAFGVACALFGTIALMWLAILVLPGVIGFILHPGVGFYALLAGFGILVFGTWKRLLAD